MNNKALARYRQTVEELKALVPNFHRVAHYSDIKLVHHYNVGHVTVKRLRLIHETGCSIENAIESITAKKRVRPKREAKQRIDPMDKPMYRPNGINWLTREWG